MGFALPWRTTGEIANSLMTIGTFSNTNVERKRVQRYQRRTGVFSVNPPYIYFYWESTRKPEVMLFMLRSEHPSICLFYILSMKQS